jgi:glycosyltransferase involved in cell wall biosynthesis
LYIPSSMRVPKRMSLLNKMKKHICMIAYTHYLEDNRVRREAETLASLPEYDVSVLSLKYPYSLPKTYTKNGVTIRELRYDKYRGNSNFRYLLSYMLFTLAAFTACNRLFFKKSIDFLHVHNMPDFLVFSGIIPMLFGKKVVLDMHDTMLETYEAKFRRNNGPFIYLLGLEERICSRLSKKIICVNEPQRNALVMRGIPESKTVIVMNVPDPKRLINSLYSGNSGETTNNFRMTYFGTVTKRLGIDLAIHVVAKLKDEIPGLKFDIFGEGENIEEFKGLIKDLGIQGNVFFNKFLQIEELFKILKNMDLVVVPNRKNAATDLMLPVKLLDSVALGIPVVVPRLKAIEHYFSDDMVFYFEPDNIDSLANAILNAYKNKDKRIMKAKNAKRFLEIYGWEKHKWNLINMYKSLS